MRLLLFMVVAIVVVRSAPGLEHGDNWSGKAAFALILTYLALLTLGKHDQRHR